MTVAFALALAVEILAEAEVAEPRKEASSLLAFVLQKDTAFLIAHSDDALAANHKILFESCVRRRAKREPFQYITRRQEFYSLEFEITPDVLIPRPETEILVEQAVKILSQLESPRFCEIGIGSGCISVAILRTVASATAVGTDISDKALTVALANAGKHNAHERLELRQTDVFTGMTGTFDLIVSNPPYVPRGQLDSLQAEVRDYEPRPALGGGVDGLEIIKRIITESPQFLKPRGALLLEIGFDQAAKVSELFDANAWKTPEFLPDLQGIPRIVKARRASSDQ